MTTVHAHKPSILLTRHQPSHSTMTFDFVASNHVDHSHKLCNINEDDQEELSSLPAKFRSVHISSPSRSPIASPVRQRSHTIDSSCFPRAYRRTRSSPSRLPKDPIQPKEGSITDIHLESQVDDIGEMGEDPFFAELPDFRSRSQTCPETIMRRRREKVRALHRPSTPPPCDLGMIPLSKTALPPNMDEKIDSLVHMDDR